MGTEGRLVGREPELASLAELVEDAGAGRGRVVLLTGEAGIGKTSLAEAVEAMARELRFDIAWGRCSSAEMPSYWPWTQVLNSLLGTAELLEPGRFASRPELYAAVAEAIEAGTRARAALVIFEDTHWADPGSLGLVAADEPAHRIHGSLPAWSDCSTSRESGDDYNPGREPRPGQPVVAGSEWARPPQAPTRPRKVQALRTALPPPSLLK